MRYLRKIGQNQQSEPHTFIHMNPLSRNPGAVPVHVPICKMKGHETRKERLLYTS